SGEIYGKIRQESNKGIWAQVKGGQETFKGGNSEGDYSDASVGLLFGFDRYVESKSLVWGVYGRFSGESIEQGESSADGQKSGLGVYGGYIQEKYEIKGTLLGSYDIFNTKRYVLGNTAKADIDALTVIADVEGALKYQINEKLNLRPYIGMEIEDANYGSFKESGAGILDLEVSGGSYIRSAARLGAGVEYEENIFTFYAKAEGKYLLSAAEPEIESALEGTNETFKSRGAQEGALEIGIGLGVEAKIASNLKIYANANYYGANKYENIYGNIGVRYMFGENE
ncbi:MAG: autotransporter outer membrane beta-barrel domain-containing protein, partial [Endomicrobium sp.]|nr:autotransporter outer membrane beta-barrel domain-containing protein [Endomicrobium sp.]